MTPARHDRSPLRFFVLVGTAAVVATVWGPRTLAGRGGDRSTAPRSAGERS